VAASTVAFELPKQLFAWVRELNSREGVLMAWEDVLAASECALGRACAECDTECDQADVVRQDYLARVHTFIASYRCCFDFNRVLEGRRFLISV
jgi:hypothetical protein